MGTTQPSLQAALTAAETNGQSDTVIVGTDGGSLIGPFSYNDPTEKITITGAGSATKPLLQAPSGQTLTVFATPDSLITDLQIHVPDASNAVALYWDCVAENLTIAHNGSQAAHGMYPKDNAELRSSKIYIYNTAATAINGQFAGAVTVRDVEIDGSALTGVSISNPGTISLTRVSIVSSRAGVQVSGNGAVVNGVQLLLRPTALLAGDGAAYVIQGGSFNANHMTAIGSGTGRGVFESTSVNNTSVTMTNSIVTGFASSLFRGSSGAGNADMLVMYSNYTGASASIGAGNGNGTFTDVAGSITASPPVFVDPSANDFRLSAGQASIDAGNPTDLSGSDLLGNARVVDGDGNGSLRSDMGAYEYQRSTPVAELQASTHSPGVGEPVSFNAGSSLDADDWEWLNFEWDFGDGSTSSLYDPTHAYATPGKRTVTLKVIDPIGLAGVATAEVDVRDVLDAQPPTGFTYRGFIVKRGRVRGTLGCPADEISCRFEFKMRTNRKIRIRGKRRYVTIARGKKITPGGRFVKVDQILSRSVVKMLRRRVPATTLTITASDAAGLSATIRRRTVFSR